MVKKTIIILFILSLFLQTIPADTTWVNETFGGSVTVLCLPSVTTNAASSISYTSVTLNGYLDNDGGEDCDVWFEYGETTSYGNVANYVWKFSSDELFTFDITGLSPDTTYHYRAVAENSIGRTNGSDVIFTTSNSVTTNETTNIATTSSRLNGYMFTDDTTNPGFWLHTDSSIGPSSFTQNISANSDGQSFYKTVTSLSPGELYYAKAHQDGNYGFINATNNVSFLTLPTSPSSISSISNSTNITLHWTNGSYEVSNYRTIVRYSKSSYPTTINDGSGINTTSTSYTFESLDLNQQYYFSLFSYTNASDHHTYSSRSTTTASTDGGTFNLTIRYENTSHQPVNLSKGYFHKLIVHFTDATQYLYFDDSGEIDTTNSTLLLLTNDTINGNIHFISNTTIKEIEFQWNNTKELEMQTSNTQDIFTISGNPTDTQVVELTYEPFILSDVDIWFINQTDFGDYSYSISSSNWLYDASTNEITIDASAFSQDADIIRISYTFEPDTPYRCNRKIIPENQQSGEIYIFTNKKVYGETTSTTDSIQNTLNFYEYMFIDNTGDFIDVDANAYCSIFIRDADGNIRVIHSEYLREGGMLIAKPQLLYNKQYYLRAFTDTKVVDLGTSPTGRGYDKQIYIYSSEDVSGGTSTKYTYYDIITETSERTDSYIKYNYADDTTGATNFTIYQIYYSSNNTLVHTQQFIEQNVHEYTFLDTDGYSPTEDYYLVVTTNISLDLLSDDNLEYNGTYYTIKHFYATRNYTKTNASWIDTLFTNLFGKSPLYRTDDGHTDDYVPWSYLIMFILAFFTMVTFSRVNGFVGMIATGFVVFIISSLIVGFGQLYGSFSYSGVVTAIIGGFLVAVGIVGVIGGIDTR